LAHYDHGKAIYSSDYRDVQIHCIHDLRVPGLTSNHLENGKQRGAQVVKGGNPEINV